ncbi:putative Ubiquitin carboxyl-terminal hydrolase 21 [Glarea lozoyensis 74030]|uniref:ubiquitinyl hydrolase 1 n=1 Tax=Glarea lozoyensis (strain ATCC 74030 / MF5533) TaxID=1104152 RepID=H0EU75_GLAL7|nr:putative Ubiquitin carboxyl-terminal hydrolase 21 [Glarea lozoyensis 74030]
MERMEEKMKGTEAENVLPSLFSGKVRTYISCINVEYESRRVEDFWDVQLNVSGNRSIEEGFKDYVQVETMDGENQYFAGDEFKLQDAKKGVIFESFPEVLHLQLKRFQYDIEHDAMMKVNDRYEFPETFDAEPYLSTDADRSEPWIYKLHSVLVHSGDLNAGHYYAFIKPTKDGWFYKYDDDKVTKATLREALEDNFGGEYTVNGTVHMSKAGTPLMRQNSAYMLVYIRESRQDKVLLPVLQEDTPPHLQRKLDEEAAVREARKKERDEQHLYLWVKVITEDTYNAHGGTDLTNFDANHDVDPAAARPYRMLRKATLRELIDKVAEDTNADPNKLRLWSMVNRQNKTTRPDMPLSNLDVTLEEAHQKLVGSKTAELRLWAEPAQEGVDKDGNAIWPVHPSTPNGVAHRTDLFLLFLKYFDVDNQQLSGAGHIYISRDKKVEELAPVILKKMGWPEKLPSGERLALKLFEVLEISLSELDTKKPVTVYWLSEGVSKDEAVNILVPKNGNAQDVVNALIKKAGIDDEETGGPIRLYELHSHKIHKEHTPPRNQSVISITDYVTLVAERIPKEDLDAQQNEIIQAFHFQGEPNKAHGIPFRFRIMENEKFADTKKRLEKRMGVKGKNFEKIKFAVVKRSSYSKPTYLNDGKHIVSFPPFSH